MSTLRTAVIPAAGRGARLDRPGTPKPLVDVGGLPLLVRTLSQLQDAGVTDAYVIVGNEAAKIVRALTGHPRLALRVHFVEAERWEDGLAASLLAARDQPGLRGAPFVLAMADHVFDERLIARAAALAPAPGEVVAVVETDAAQVFDVTGAVKVALDGDHVTAIGELATFDAIDAGLFAATPALFDALAAARGAGGTGLTDALTLLARARKVRAVATEGLSWDDIDTPAAAVHAEIRLRRERRLHAVKRIASPPPSGDRYNFVTGARTTTNLVVRRGIASGEHVDLGIPAESSSSPLFVLTDTTVDRLYADRFVTSLERDGYQVHKVVMPEGERAKTLENYGWLIETVLANGIDEHSILISLGGGVVNNVTGFAAATLYRGIGLIHVPTTLMAQCDAAISHKQALNGARGKNLLGAYYPPIRIVVDVDFLQTLSDRLLRDGLAEALKHALAQDASYYDWFMAQDTDLRDPAWLEYVVRRNIELKCLLMADDPKEHAEGLVLQYAHNVAHAVEYLSGYQLTHGESVSIGMMVAAHVSRLLRGAGDAVVAHHDRLLAKYGLPRTIPATMRIADILDAMRYDKKTHTEGFRMPLLTGVGTLWKVGDEYAIPVSDSVMAAALAACHEAP